MKPIRTEVAWKYLDDFRGKEFKGTWPTLPELFKISQLRYPTNPCFVDFDGKGGTKQVLDYTQVLNNITQLAQWMMSIGIKKGDHIAVSGKNSPEWATVFIASMLAGGIAIPIDYALHESEMDNLLNASKPKLFFVDEEKIGHFQKAKKGPKIYSLSRKHSNIFVYNLKSDKKEKPFPEVTEKDTATILFTSGTTGTPKGVMLSHQNLVCDGLIAQQNLYIYSTDVFYQLLPVHHAYTMQAALIVPLACGSSIVFGKSMAVSKLMRELREGKITVMLGVPLLYNKLYSGIMKGIAEKGVIASLAVKLIMNISFIWRKLTGKNTGRVLLKAILDAANLSTLRVAICGGGPLAASVFRGYNAMGIDFIQGYGLTETSPIITLNPIEHFKIESVGMDFSPYEEIKILNPDAKGIGEIAVKGPMVMQGYYNMPEETAAMFTEDGFLKTGDIGWMDDEHFVMLSGRAKNLIVTEGGKNVYPEEIEDAFQLFYDVEQIMVRGYIANAGTKSEQIEALIYPADDLLKRHNITSRTDPYSKDVILAEINQIVEKVNRNQPSYAKISKVTILTEPLEMTTTRKIKRAAVNKKELEELPAAVESEPALKPIKAKKSPAKKAAAKKPAAAKTAKTASAKPKAETKAKPASKAKTTAKPKAAAPVKKAAAKKTPASAAKKQASAKPAKAANTKKTPAKRPAAKKSGK